MELTERDDGVLELRPVLPVPADQAWFWTEHWQQREREVDGHMAAGRLAARMRPWRDRAPQRVRMILARRSSRRTTWT